jgi:DNA (cytosine-5)-methyltransferase 1
LHDFNHISLFAGMGGFVLGLERQGVKTLMTNDIESSCVETLSRLCPPAINCSLSIDDPKILELAKSLGPVDILSGGFPCQPFSVAGAQDGFQDLERGSKFFDMMKFVNALRTRPKVLFLENVGNLKTYNDGQWLSDIFSELRFSGYWVNDAHCFLLNSLDCSPSPQTRERLFIVAYHSSVFRRNYFNSDFSDVRPRKKSLWEIIDRKVKAEKRIYLDPENKHYLMIRAEADKAGSDRLFQIRRGSVRANPVGVCPTLTANMGGGGHNVPFVIDDFGIRRLSVQECLVLQGFHPGEFAFPSHLSDSAKLKMIGNSVNPDVIDVISERIVGDLRTYGNRMAISA